jgi:hypothetical protein
MTRKDIAISKKERITISIGESPSGSIRRNKKREEKKLAISNSKRSQINDAEVHQR